MPKQCQLRTAVAPLVHTANVVLYREKADILK